MADEQPTTPLSIADKLKLDAKTLWNDHKLFFIIFGALILLVKFRDIAIDLLVSGAKKEVTETKKEDAVLAAYEKKANDAANQLVQQAKDEPLKQGPIDDDWNKKP